MPQPTALLDPRGDAPIRPDGDLVDRLRAGDDQAFTEFYELVVRPARRCALGYVSDGDADDVVADTIIAVWRAIGRGNGPADDPLPYVLRAVRTTAWRLHRRRRSETTKAERARALQGPAADDPVLLDPDLTRAFRSLTPRHQLVLWWTVIEGRPPAEVGAALGISANTAAALGMRARQALRRSYLEATGPGPTSP